MSTNAIFIDFKKTFVNHGTLLKTILGDSITYPYLFKIFLRKLQAACKKNI